MRKLRHLSSYLISATLLLSACSPEHVSGHAPGVVPTSEHHKNVDASPAQISSTLEVKSEQPKEETRSPLLDVGNAHTIVSDAGLSSRGTSSSSYNYPHLGGSGSGGSRQTGETIAQHEMDMLREWNTMAVDASGRDHKQPSIISILGIREQIGPGRSARAMAIVHIAIFEAINAIKGGYESYVGLPPANGEADVEAAIAIAAYDTLKVLFTSQKDIFDYQMGYDLQKIPNSPKKDLGIEIGHKAAAMILAMRENDGSAQPEPIIGVDYFPSNAPGIWRKDPISQLPAAVGARWSEVKTFVLQSAEQFRAPPPPALSSHEYAVAFNEVKSLGGDGVNTPTIRTEDQTEIGLFWAYDGVPSLCAPPRLYNQVARQLALDMGVDMVETARLLALVNVAMADAAIAIWESKYHYQVWRPITGIREADPGTGPTEIGDQNPETEGDANFFPLGAPASNITNGVNFTPPFPAYPSGHAGFGGTIFEVMRKFFGRDDIAFTFVSDELNGITKDNDGFTRPLKPRSFTSLSQAEEENGQSRIYLGIHWAFDKTGGVTQGHQIANYIFNRLYQPVVKK